MIGVITTRVRAVLAARQTARRGILVIVSLTLLSKALGFLREVLVAYFFGATALVDAFVVASNIYSLTTGMASHAFGVAGTPLLVEKGLHEGPAAQRATFHSFLRFALLVGLGVAVLVVGFAPWVVRVLAPSFSPQTHALSAWLARLMFPTALGMVGVAIAGAYLNATRRFGWDRLGDLAVNIVMVCFLFLASAIGIHSLALGSGLGYLLAGAALLTPLLWGRSWIRGRAWNREVKEFLALSSPMLVAYAAYQLNAIIDRAFASSLNPGSIASLSYAWRLFSVPEVFAGALATVHLTRASEMAGAGQLARLKSSTYSLLLWGALVAVPATVVIALLRKPIVQLVFEHGAFDAAATTGTATALACYGFGLFPVLAVLVLSAALRGTKDMKTPVVAAVAGIAVNITLNFLLIRHFGVGGLATASSVAALVNALVLFAGLALKKGGMK